MHFKLVFNYLSGKCSPLCGTGVYWNAGKCLPSGRCLCFWGWTGPNAQYTTNNKILVGNRMGNIPCTRRMDQFKYFIKQSYCYFTILYCKFKFSNKKLYLYHVTMWFFVLSHAAVPSFRAVDVTLNLAHCDISFISSGVPRELHASNN